MKAYWIRSDTRIIEEVDYRNLADLQRMVGGYIELAKAWPGGDVLFVDDQGVLKEGPKTWFYIVGHKLPLAGNGVVVGRELDEDEDEDEDDGTETAPPEMTLEQLKSRITFPTADKIAAWARANSSDPAVTIWAPGEKPVVIKRIGPLYGGAPPSKGPAK